MYLDLNVLGFSIILNFSQPPNDITCQLLMYKIAQSMANRI